MPRPDITRKILDNLAGSYDGTIGAQPDLTTWLRRKYAQDRVSDATSAVSPLRSPSVSDFTDDVRTYLNDLADNTTP